MDQNQTKSASKTKEMGVSYKECLKNHAATMGGHALDGCGEFMLTPTATPSDPISLKCAACGCHRNFHRRDPYEFPIQPFLPHLPPPPNPTASPSPDQSLVHSPSPTSTQTTPPSPAPHSYYSSAPHMLLALSTGHSGPSNSNRTAGKRENPSGRKRSRTKFSREQKQKMFGFAEKVGWKMPRNGDNLVDELCREIGVERGVLKVWMHNNKNNFGKRSSQIGIGAVNINKDDNFNPENGKRDSFENKFYCLNSNNVHLQVPTVNGSSS